MKNIKSYIKYFIKYLLRVLSRLFYIFPIKKNRILFSSYWGEKVADNPKCIYDFLLEHCKDRYEYIWVYNEKDKGIDLHKKDKLIKRFSINWVYYMVTSKIIIDNCTPTMVIPRRKGQIYIETWHGGGAYKKVGVQEASSAPEIKSYELAMNTANIFVSSSKEFTKEDIKAGYHYTGRVMNCGMPRNDIFFDAMKVRKASDKVRKYFSLHGYIVLYAPTFRGDLKHSDAIQFDLDVNRLQDAITERYGENASILVRCHHWDGHKYGYNRNVIEAESYPDMQELLCASDILITDYSSSMWDFALLGRPCLLYTPDLDQYDKNRGFFTPIEEWPGIICRNMEDLCNEIQNLNEEECAIKAKNYLKMMGSYETGHATEKIYNYILKCIY